MPALEVVIHCWKYARLLTYQLSSLYLHPLRDGELSVTVWHAPTEDPDTVRVLKFFSSLRPVPGLTWSWRCLPHEYLVNRAIGRNLSALETQAEWIWFADADYVVREGFLDTMLALLRVQTTPLIYPEVVQATTHEDGARLIEDMSRIFAECGPQVVEVTEDGLIEQRFSKAIGGVQFAKGEACRSLGYCNKPREQQPYGGNWRPDVEDRKFRLSLGTPGAPVLVPGLVRIRHGERGGPAKVVEF